MFQHTAARRRLIYPVRHPIRDLWFQHTAARRRLTAALPRFQLICVFQHTAARRRLTGGKNIGLCVNLVSTHSRPKAADRCRIWMF